MSRQELADEINAWLYRSSHGSDPANGAVSGPIDAGYIGKLERGKHRWPRAACREAFRAVLGVGSDRDLGFYIVRGNGVSTRATAGTAPARSVEVHVDRNLDRHEMLAHLRQQWHLLVQADNLFGPRHALAGVEAQLAILDDLLSIELGRDRRDALVLAARYAESAAWLNQDLGHGGRAREWNAQALEWAHQVDDASMVAWAVYRRSQQQLIEGRPRDALDLARAARREEHRLAKPMRAAIRVQEAHALAALGEHDEPLRLLDQAHRWAADDRRGTAEAGHGSFCTAGYIEVHRATCLRLLGRYRDAIGVFDQALPTIPAVYRRDRAAALASKSAALAAAGQPDIAAATALAALPVARRAGSQRIVSQLADVATTLHPHYRIEPVARLIDGLGQAA